MKTVSVREDGSKRVSISFPESEAASVNRVKPQFYKDCDINVIMKRYKKTGILGNPLLYRDGSYGDFSSGADFAEVMRKVKDVQNIFSELPSDVRSRFKNDPQNMLDFLVDPKNDDEAIKLGLKNKPKSKARYRHEDGSLTDIDGNIIEPADPAKAPVLLQKQVNNPPASPVAGKPST